jgi:hypothetical protein
MAAIRINKNLLMRKLCAAFRIWKRIWRALTGPLIENGIPTEALIAHVLVAFRSCSSAPSLSLLLGLLAGFAADCSQPPPVS